MIIAAAMAMAVSANAASYVWKTASSGGTIRTPGQTTGGLASATAYLFAAGTEETIFNAFRDGTLDLSTAGSLDNSPVANGKVAYKETPFTYSGDCTAYLAVLTKIDGKDYLYISPTGSAADPQGVGNGEIQIKALATSSVAATTIDKTSSWGSKAGWYTQAVPEPTSGLLLLLGVAGLALRRRRA